MDQSRWDQIQSVFHQVVDCAPEEQMAMLDALCGNDRALWASVKQLIDEDARTDGVLDSDSARIAHRLLDDETSVPAVRSFGPYSVKSELGRGGMGVVYLAERSDIGQRVAIKLLRDAWVSPDTRQRFAREQQTLAHLDHPSIAKVFDADALPDGTPWFAMEYVEGTALTAYCEAHACSVSQRLQLFREVCEAVQHAHRNLIIHRDLKPSNILVTGAGAVKLLDFGIAKQLATIETVEDPTRTVMRQLTPAYSAPEQIAGRPVSVQADVYSLGVILYELLSGQRPYDGTGASAREVEQLALDAATRPPSTAGRPARHGAGESQSAWADLDTLCLTAMHVDPDRRYFSVEALMRDVDHFLAGQPLDARPDSLAYRADKFVRRHRRPLLVACAAIVVLAGVAGFYTVRLSAARALATEQSARTQRVQEFMLNLFDAGEQDAAPASDLRVVTLVDRGFQEAQSLSQEPAVQAELFHTLGTIYERLGNYERGEKLLRDALDQRRALYGDEHADVAESLTALGLLRAERAEYDEAEKFVREGLEMSRRVLPAGHPVTARATAALGKIFEERGDYAQAIPLLNDAVAMYRTHDAQSVELAATMTELANAHFFAGHLDESATLNRQVLEVDRRVHGDRHPNVADDLINLGAIASQQGNYVEAERVNREALGIIEAWYGSGHEETASAQANLAQQLMYLGRLDEARPLLRQALASQQKNLGPVHPRVAFIWNELGSVSLRAKDYDEADNAFTQALEINRKVAPGTFRVGVALSNLGSVATAREDYARAEQYFRQAIENLTKAQSAEHPNTVIARVKLGRALVRQGKYAEAEDHLRFGEEMLTKRPAGETFIRSAREDLITVYEATQRPQEAKQIKEKLAAESQKVHSSK
jgi:serine/threonine-protein kinase